MTRCRETNEASLYQRSSRLLTRPILCGALMLCAVTRTGAPQQAVPATTQITSVDCPICTQAQWDRWHDTYSWSQQATGHDVLGHRIGSNDALSHNAAPGDNPKWRVIDAEKRTVCGGLRKFGIGDYGGPEYDWSLVVEPTPA